MSLIQTGKYAEFIILVISVVIIYYYLYRAIRGQKMELRELPVIGAISDAVDRAVETGKPVFMGPGNLASLSGMFAPMTIAGMNIWRYTATLAVRKGARLIGVVPRTAEVHPLMDGIYREVAVAEGKPEAYKAQDLVYPGYTENAMFVSIIGLFAKEGVEAVIWHGACSGTSEIKTAGIAKAQFDALVIAGTVRYNHQGSFAVIADYPSFMDDVYAAGVYVSGDEATKASLVGGDIVKLILLGATVLFLVLAAARLPVLGTRGWLYI